MCLLKGFNMDINIIKTLSNKELIDKREKINIWYCELIKKRDEYTEKTGEYTAKYDEDINDFKIYLNKLSSEGISRGLVLKEL